MARSMTTRGAVAGSIAAMAVPLLAVGATAAGAETTDGGLLVEYVFSQDAGTSVANLAPDSAFGPATVVNGLDSDWTGTALTLRGGAKGGSGDWVELPDNLLVGAESATVTAEVKASAAMINGFHFLWNIGNDSPTTEYFFSSLNCGGGRSPLVGIKAAGTERLMQSGACGISADTWVNISTVVDGEAGTASFYVNGDLVRTGAMPVTPGDVLDQSLNAIGRAPWPDPLFQGAIASFRVYDQALSADEVAAISAADAALNATEIEGYASALLEDVEPVVITDTTTALPDYGGRVTYGSDMPGVEIGADGVTATAVQPAVGGEPLEGTLTASATVRGVTATREVPLTIEPTAAPDDDYGYLMVHFIEDADGYAEKIYLDVSRGDDPERWDPLNGGEPILASHLSTTGVRDPYLTYSPDTGTYYIIATDLRVFGGDGIGWGGWTSDYSTRVNVWESTDLVSWSELRQFDVALDGSGAADPTAPDMEMMWAPEATWVADYYGEGQGAFVMYWSSALDGGYHRVMWGATPDFTQETWEFGGVLIDAGGNTIDTTMIQDGTRTYRVTKDNAAGKGLYMEFTDAPQWWLPEAEWTMTQSQIGAEYAGGNPGGVEGPAMFKVHGENTWYLYADVIPSIGYRPLSSTDLDAAEPWQMLDSPGFSLAESTKHGGIVGLTKAQYDTVRGADAVAGVAEGDLAAVTVEFGAHADAVEAALPATAEAALHDGRGTASFAVDWDLSDLDTSSAGTSAVTGTLLGTVGANLNQWVGEAGSTAWNAPGKQPFSSTAIEVTATVTVEPAPISFIDVEGSEHAAAIGWLAAEGISTGWSTPEGQEFRPLADITRDAMAAFLYRYAGSPEVTLPAESPFVDVTPDSTEFYEEIVWMFQEGISTGWETSEGREYRPLADITRDAMAAFLYRSADSPEWSDPDVSPFVDLTASSTEFFTEITWLESVGITTGWSTPAGQEYRPLAHTTRDAMATFLYRFNQLS